MPNHVFNVVSLNGEKDRIKQLMCDVAYEENENSYMEVGEGTIDFEKIVPMPHSLAIESGSTTDRAIVYYVNAINPETDDFGIKKADADAFSKIMATLNGRSWFKYHKSVLSEEDLKSMISSTHPEKLVSIGKQAIDNLLLYGATTWYDWSIENWGTKWNAYNQYTGQDDGFRFSTAWSAPHPVLDALAKKYPDIRITHEWADEDIGQNCGRREYENGVCVYDWEPDSNKDAIEFATGVWGDTPEDYGMALNAAETDYVYTYDEKYELIELFGKPALFTNERLNKADIPKGLYVCHVRGDDEATGGFAELAPRVLVNHFGSIVTKEPVDFGEKGYILFTDETEPHFTGRRISFSDFMDDRLSMDE